MKNVFKKATVLLVGAVILIAGAATAKATDPPELLDLQCYKNGSWSSAHSVAYKGSCGIRCDEYYADFVSGGDLPNGATAFRVTYSWVIYGGTFGSANMWEEGWDSDDIYDRYTFGRYGSRTTHSETSGVSIAWTSGDYVANLTGWYNNQYYVTKVYYRTFVP